MPDATTTSYLSVSDFSPGMQSLESPLDDGQPWPVGSSNMFDPDGNSGTYDCISLPGGGLGSLPFKFTTLSTGPAAAPDPGKVLGGGDYLIGSIHAPKFYAGEVSGGNTNDYSCIFFTLNYPYDNGAGTITRRVRVYRFDAFLGTLTEIQNLAGATPCFESGVWTSTLTAWYAYTPMCDYRTNGTTNPTIPGPPYVMIGICDPSVEWGGVSGAVSQIHDPANPARRKNFLNRKQVVHLVSHQGRLFVNCQETAFSFGNREVLHDDDNYWTVPNQDGLDNGGNTSAFSQATVGAYGAIGSSNANELVMIRSTSKGGLVATSDLNSPVVADYATMQGTMGCIVQPVWTPMGLVYGAMNDGIYVYSGGGRTQLLSPMLEGGFWHSNVDHSMGQGFLAPTNTTAYNPLPVPALGKFAYHGGFVFCPGNWLYDIVQNNWWKFQGPDDSFGDPFTLQWFDTSPFGDIYAAPSHWRTPGDMALSHARLINFSQPLYGNSIPAGYKWTSNLIPIAQESEVNEVREVVVVCEGTVGDTVKVSLWPDASTGGAIPWTKTFTIGTGGTTFFRTPVTAGAIRGTRVIMQLETTVAVPNSNWAPNIFRVDLGLGQIQTIPNS